MIEIIVTAGSAYVDIDALACSYAYANLLRLNGKNAVALHSAPFNVTIPPTVISWNRSMQVKQDGVAAHYVIVDVSNPKYIEKFVDLQKVSQVFDHHFGFEEYWFEKLGLAAKIEPIGACATLIWEEYVSENKTKLIDVACANLLYTAIIANTLNTKANITCHRDLVALEQLREFTDLPNNWERVYYTEIEKNILRDIPKAIKNDCKEIVIEGKKYTIGQLELWDTSTLLLMSHLIKLIKQGLDVSETSVGYWFLIVSDIKIGVNYIITTQVKSQKVIENLFSIEFSDNVAKTNSLWMRKEIIRELFLV